MQKDPAKAELTPVRKDQRGKRPVYFGSQRFLKLSSSKIFRFSFEEADFSLKKL